MPALRKLTVIEAKLFARDPIALFFGLLFPGLLLLLLGLFFPGFTDPSPELGGLAFITFFTPVVVVMGLTTLGLVTLPPTLATYRQFGILRRLRTTPVHPFRLLCAQLFVFGTVGVVASLAVCAVAIVVFDVQFPEQPGWLALSYALAAVSIFAIGLLVSARARTTAGGQGLGMALYFPSLFFAGVWIPRSVMTDGLRRVSDFTPVGAAAQAFEDSWLGVTPSVLHLGVMAVWAAVAGLVAVRGFRWE